MSNTTTYIIEITPLDKTGGRNDAPYLETIRTDDIQWSMEQYQRNRPPLAWEIVNEE